ncbi:MAG TPA: hypothetical protein VF053_15450, partial [Streptosporangiales bacterium]
AAVTDEPATETETPPPPPWAEGTSAPRITSWYADAFRRHAAPLRAVLVATLPVAVAGVLLELVLQLSTETLVVNGRFDMPAPPPAALIAAGVLLLAGLAALTLAAAAAGLSVAAVRTDEPRTVRWALATAARRWAALTGYTLLVLVVLVACAAAGGALLLAHAPAWFAVAVAVLVLGLCTCLLGLAWPLVLVEGRGLFGAIAQCWRVTEQVRILTGLKVLVFGYAFPLAVVALARFGLDRAGDRLAVWPWQLVNAAVVPALGTVGVAVIASVHVGVLFSVRRPMPGDLYLTRSPLDQERVAAALADGGRPEWRWQPRRAGAVAAAVVAAALLPGLLSGGLLWWNPSHAVSESTAVVDDDPPGPTSVSFPQPDGSVVLAVGPYRRLRHCAGSHCGYAIPGTTRDDGPDPVDLEGASVTGDGHGGLVYAGWLTPGANGESTTPTLRLVGCRPAACTADAVRRAQPALLDRFRPSSEADRFQRQDALTAVARRGAGYVVASVGFAAHRPHVTLYQCADVRCADPVRTDVGRVDLYSVRAFDAGILSLSIAPDGRPVVTVADGNTGAVHLLACSDARCGRSAWRTVAAPVMISTSYETLRLSGAGSAVLPDGRPVVAYRDASSGTSMLAVCRDRDCTSTTTRRLTGPGWAHPAPAVVVGRAGHPMVASYDLPRRQLVLVACHDATCTTRTTARLATWHDGPGWLSLSLDAAGRPVVTWADANPWHTFFQDVSLRLLHCVEPGCGATS